ncbi:hypothetical protein Pfo_005389 [Paulownia fortunei]|nr:hypothetical protein Pfo_005389 [Paulownia fortunei]
MPMERNIIDATSGGALVDKIPEATRNLIANMATNSQQFITRNDLPPPPKSINEVNTSLLEQKLSHLTSLVQQIAVGQQPYDLKIERTLCLLIKDSKEERMTNNEQDMKNRLFMIFYAFNLPNWEWLAIQANIFEFKSVIIQIIQTSLQYGDAAAGGTIMHKTLDEAYKPPPLDYPPQEKKSNLEELVANGRRPWHKVLLSGPKILSPLDLDGQKNLSYAVRAGKTLCRAYVALQEALNKSNFESYSSRVHESLSCWTPDCIGFNLIEAILCHICRKERPGAVLVFMTGWEDISCLRDQLKAHPLLGDPNRVLLLTCHGSMATSEQKLIFEKPPPNVRKIILATNMAEASITINDIVFVVDCGKAKETTYDALNNTQCLLPSWISQASARQRRGRAGRVQPGECYHLYPQCVYEAFAEYQLPELLRTPLNSLCLQIKSLQVESIGDFLSAALQPPEPLAVQNAVDFLKMIGALDENENLTHLGKFLSVLPVDPKLGKMLIMGAIFRCFDPILTIVAGLSVRDPFLLPQDKKDLAGTAKSRFSAKDYSDHMALVRAYEGWKDAEREGSAYEYCWRNFLSLQTLQAIHSLRKQFTYILKDAGLLDTDGATNNRLSHNQPLVRAIICSGLFPGIASVVHRETSMSFKTMDDGQVLLYANSVNARYQTIQYPWLVFGEKVKVNTVFIRDSTGVSDSILILFGGKLGYGAMAGNLKMLEGYIDFFMDPSLAECYVKLKEELEKLLQKKLQQTSTDIHKEGKYLMLAVQELVSGDQCEGRFVFGRESKKPRESCDKDRFTKDGTNPKSLLQTLLMRAGHSPPKYKTKHLKTNEFRALVLAEKDAAIEALAWLTQTSENNHDEDDNTPPDVTDNMLKLLGRRRSQGDIDIITEELSDFWFLSYN